MKDLEGNLLEYETAEEFLADIRKKLRGKNKETVKIAELKRLEQGGKIIGELL